MMSIPGHPRRNNHRTLDPGHILYTTPALTFSLHVNLAAFADRVRRRYQVPGGLRYVDFHRLASGLHTGRSVDRVPEQAVPRHLHADDAGHHGAGMYAHADLQMRFCGRHERVL